MKCIFVKILAVNPISIVPLINKKNVLKKRISKKAKKSCKLKFIETLNQSLRFISLKKKVKRFLEFIQFQWVQ